MINNLLYSCGAKMLLYYGVKSGASKDIHVRLCGRYRNNKSNCYPNNDNFKSIAGLVDIFFVDSICSAGDFFGGTQPDNYLCYCAGENMFFLKRSVPDNNRLCCYISKNNSFHCSASAYDPVAILNTWTGNISSVEYQTW